MDFFTSNMYTVIGTYTDNDQPFAFHILADDAKEAVTKAHKSFGRSDMDGDLLIAGVALGVIDMVGP